jgi:23S rRNA pseudoU1915 N3-methylase RlmH
MCFKYNIMIISNILKPISVALAIFLAADYSLAGPLPDYSFKSPAFNGNGYSTHELTKYNLEQTRAKEIQQAMEAKVAALKAEAKNTPINQFMVNLESRIYAQISQNLATAMFADGAATTGSMTFQGNTIYWNKNGTTSITLMVTDTLGNNTTIEVPLGQFTFN